MVGYLLAAFLLISTTTNPVVMLLLPAWAVLVGLVILIRARNLAEPNCTTGEDRMTTTTAPTGRSIDEIPGPKGVPVLGNMFDVPAERTIQTAMELTREFGPIIRLRTPVGDRFIASGLDMIDDLCDDERFDKLVGDGQKAVRSFGRSAGLFTSDTDDPNWSKAHNILLPNFSTQAMRDYLPMMNDIAAQLMQKWERLNPGEPVDVTADMTRLTLDTIALCGFGYRFNSFYRDTQHPFVERHDGRAAGEPDPEP